MCSIKIAQRSNVKLFTAVKDDNKEAVKSQFKCDLEIADDLNETLLASRRPDLE